MLITVKWPGGPRKQTKEKDEILDGWVKNSRRNWRESRIPSALYGFITELVGEGGFKIRRIVSLSSAERVV